MPSTLLRWMFLDDLYPLKPPWALCKARWVPQSPGTGLHDNINCRVTGNVSVHSFHILYPFLPALTQRSFLKDLEAKFEPRDPAELGRGWRQNGSELGTEWGPGPFRRAHLWNPLACSQTGHLTTARRLTEELWQFTSPTWEDASLLSLCRVASYLIPWAQLHRMDLSPTQGPPEPLANSGRHDLPRSPDGSGLWDPLTGMDACIQPNGWPLLASSRAELQKGREARKWPASPRLSSPLLSPASSYSFNSFKIIQRPNVPEGTVYLSGLSVTWELNWLAAALGSPNLSSFEKKWKGETIGIVGQNASVVGKNSVSLERSQMVSQQKHKGARTRLFCWCNKWIWF